jgi:hypothetical protein
MSDQVSVFISYAHEDAELARALASSLKKRGCKVWIDEGEMLVGESLIERIATAISEVHFVVALVSEASVNSPWCQKELSLAITGGLGREGVRVLPLQVGDVEMPATLADVLYLPLDPSSVSDAAARIKKDAEGHLAREKPSVPVRCVEVAPAARPPAKLDEEAFEFEPIKLVGIAKEGVGKPRDDGTRGSALYAVPLRLSRRPPADWATLFVHNWDRPPSFSTMHRPGICRVSGDTAILDGTTMEELEKYHLKTLKLALQVTNERYEQHLRSEFERKKREREAEDLHRREVEDIASRLKFDDEP